MRKLCLTVAAAAAISAAGLLGSGAQAMTLGGSAVRSAADAGTPVDQVRYVCTHWWNGRWHPRELCNWAPGPAVVVGPGVGFGFAFGPRWGWGHHGHWGHRW
jgi:hypothetical protein